MCDEMWGCIVRAWEAAWDRAHEAWYGPRRYYEVSYRAAPSPLTPTARSPVRRSDGRPPCCSPLPAAVSTPKAFVFAEPGEDDGWVPIETFGDGWGTRGDDGRDL